MGIGITNVNRQSVLGGSQSTGTASPQILYTAPITERGHGCAWVARCMAKETSKEKVMSEPSVPGGRRVSRQEEEGWAWRKQARQRKPGRVRRYGQPDVTKSLASPEWAGQAGTAES